MVVVVKNAGDVDSSPDWGTEIPHDTEQLSPHATTTEPAHPRAHVLQLESLCAAMKVPT